MRNEAQLRIAEVDDVGRLGPTRGPPIGSLIDLLLIDLTGCFQMQVVDECQQVLRSNSKRTPDASLRSPMREIANPLIQKRSVAMPLPAALRFSQLSKHRRPSTCTLS